MTAAGGTATRPRRRALLLACGRFDDPELPSLRSPSRDADALEKVLSGVDYEVTKVVDRDVQDARRSIALFLDDARRTDVNLIYFSCHGIQDADANLYFAFGDTQHNMPDVTAVAADFVRRRISSSRSRSTIVLIDCCFSGAFLHGMRAKAGRDAGVGALVRDLPEGSGVAVLTSSGATEVSLEDPSNRDEAARRGSYFTEALLTGLVTGAADRDNDGRITIDELFSYASDRVADGPSRQKPCKLVHAVGDLVVAKVSIRLREPPPPTPPTAAADTMLIDRATLAPWPPLPPAPAFQPTPTALPTIAASRATVRFPAETPRPGAYPPVQRVYGRKRPPRRRLPPLIAAGTLAVLAGAFAVVATRDPTARVPTVIGLDRAAAEEQLRKAGLTPTPLPAPSASTAATCTSETVTDQSPRPGSNVSPGTAVGYAVCSSIKVPDVLDQTWTSAKNELTKAGFRTRLESAGTKGCRRNRVAGQDPKPGAKAARNSTIVIKMCTGSAPSPSNSTAPPTKPPVPCVIGFSLDAAKAAIESANLNATVMNAEGPETPGTIITQSPSCGIPIEPGSTVTLTYSVETTTPTNPSPETHGDPAAK